MKNSALFAFALFVALVFAGCGKEEAIVIDDGQSFCPREWYFLNGGYLIGDGAVAPSGGSSLSVSTFMGAAWDIEANQSMEFSLLAIEPSDSQAVTLGEKHEKPFGPDLSFINVTFKPEAFEQRMFVSTVLAKPDLVPNGFSGFFGRQDSLVEAVFSRNSDGFFIVGRANGREAIIADSLPELSFVNIGIHWSDAGYTLGATYKTQSAPTSEPAIDVSVFFDEKPPAVLFGGFRAGRKSAGSNDFSSGKARLTGLLPIFGQGGSLDKVSTSLTDCNTILQF